MNKRSLLLYIFLSLSILSLVAFTKKEGKKSSKSNEKQSSKKEEKKSKSVSDDFDDYDPSNSQFANEKNVILNADPSKLEDILTDSNLLNFLYVIDSATDKHQQMTDQIIKPLINELKGYMRVFVFDCQYPPLKKDSSRFQMCEKEEYTPFFQLFKPPQVKINPYTGKPMQQEQIQFKDNEVTYKKVYNFVLNNLPDFSEPIDTQKKLDDFNSTEEADINKVLLFTQKAKTPAIFKALSAQFRDQLRFGIIQQEKEDLIRPFEVRKFPQIRVYESFDKQSGTLLDQVKQVKYKGDKDFKLSELIEFLEPFARKDLKEKVAKQSSSSNEEESKNEESSRESKKSKKKKGGYVELDEENFESAILDSEKAALVFFIKGDNVTEEVPLFNKILKEVRGPMNVGVYKISEQDKDLNDKLKQKYKLSHKLPLLKFYKNQMTGEDKLKKSYEIIDSKLDLLIEELHESLDHNVKEVNEKIVNNLAISSAREGKFVIIYYYDDERISLHFKAISAMNIFKDSFDFLAFYQPSQQIMEAFNFKSLPGVGGVLPVENELDEQLKQFAYQGRIDFDEMLNNFLKMSNKEDEYYKQEKKAKKKEIERKFEEIVNQDMFQKNCLDRQKACAIALLNAQTILEYEQKNFEEHLQILQELEKEAKTQPIYYMWVNASCHNYLLDQFEVNPMFVPTVVFYYPEKNKYAHLIGKFDKETIQIHEQKFISGKLPIFDLKVKKSDIQFKSLDCPSLQLETTEEESSSSSYDDEILQEILAEEEQRKKDKKQKQKAEGGSSKNKKKSSKKKKSKGGDKDDL